MKDRKSILIFGAGKIGRSFIGQLFGQSGYEVVFVDVDQKIVGELNHRKSYSVVFKGEWEETIFVKNIRAVSGFDKDTVIKEIAQTSLIAVSVGKNALEKIIPVLAEGLKLRLKQTPDLPLDIIIAENMRSANEFIHPKLLALLPENYPLDQLVGLVETSIGKMVPIMLEDIERADPLLVYAEPYNTLIVDKNGFKNPIPDVKGLSAKENIKAWVDRKAFIHNLGHAAVAYYGYNKYPREKYLYGVLNNRDALSFTYNVMAQSANALSKEYPVEFNIDDLFNHILDLVSRFRNKALGDTVFRIGSDLRRKLSKEDRVVGAIRLAQKHNCCFNNILKVLIYGLSFKATDECDRLFPGDKELILQIGLNLKNVLIEVCGFDLQKDKEIIKCVMDSYNIKKA